ncbi:glutaredoxin [Lacrimispora sp. 210928-DFI.3.58]|uniref:glutaredoxin n=1 Tax=Lacrimispora sp. 210928-DFI.3.58 TaxID=2883214 RepID=UPI001D08BE0C|nr:glutaredoxin [Lacrimispora sp. 210928-DFI.3.58]MCB7318592.1 glutaredoxin [Lacrimispora sp. 210928-DFI.3.58]
MKITVIGSHLCPDTLYALCKLKEAGADIDFQNLSASLPDLKAYLAVRESNDMYEAVRKAGGIGIPFFRLEDGTETMDLDVVLKKIK